MSGFPKCPDCGADSVAQLDYPGGRSYYCPECAEKMDGWKPKPLGEWARWNPKPGDYKENESQIGKTRRRLGDAEVA